MSIKVLKYSSINKKMKPLELIEPVTVILVFLVPQFFQIIAGRKQYLFVFLLIPIVRVVG